MAAIPQNTTRMVGRKGAAPPARAPTTPSNAKLMRDTIETIHETSVEGESAAAMTGSSAPAENAPADAQAACMGLADVASEIPNSSRA